MTHPNEITSYMNSADLTGLSNRIPNQIKQAVEDVITSDSTACYYFSISKTEHQFQFFLMEHNEHEPYTVCHAFSTDIGRDLAYTYEKMPLADLLTFSNMAQQLNLNYGAQACSKMARINLEADSL